MDAEQAAKLRAPFPPELVGKLPKAGTMLDYVGHAATTDRLLQVDPDWTWEPMAVGPNGEPLVVDGGLWIKLTVCGVTRPGWGDGKNIKEMIGDAIRNAAMRFGVALDLWAKEDLHGFQAAPAPAAAEPPRTQPSKKELAALVELVDGLIADGQVTPDAIARAAGGEWPAVADRLDQVTVVGLTERLTRFKESLVAA